MVNEDIVNYLKEGVKRGFSLELLKQKLKEGGFNEKDIEEAAKSIPPKEDSKKNEQKDSGENVKKETQQKLVSNSVDKKPTVEMKKADVKPIADTNKIGVFRKIGKAIAHPSELFEKTKSEGVGSALLYLYLILLVPILIGGIALYFVYTNYLSSFLTYVSFPAGVLNFLQGNPNSLIILGIYLGAILILSPIFLFLSSGILHLIVKIFGGKGNYAGTFKSVVYGMTPSVLFFFIPGMQIWSFVLHVIGISVYHELPKSRAFLTCFVLVLLSFAAGLLISFFAV